MKMGRVVEVLPDEGQVTVLLPAESTLRAAATTPPSRHEPSYLQADHLDTRRSSDADQQGLWLGASWRLPEPVDVDAWQQAFTRYVRRHGALHGWFAVQPESASGYVRHDLPPEQIEFTWQDVGDATGEELRRLVVSTLRDGCDPLRPFGYCCLLVRGEGTTRVVVAADHTYSDAFSLLLAHGELAALYDEEAGGQAAVLGPVGDYRQHADSEREVARQAGLDHPAVASWVDFWQAGGDLGRFPVRLGVEPGRDYRLEPYFIDLLTEDEATRLEARAREAGANFVTAVYAACALAGRDLGDASSFRFVNPVHTRHDAELFTAAGWFVGLVPVHVDVDADDDLLGVARRVRAEFTAQRPVGELPFLRAYELITEAAGRQVGSSGGRHLFSYMDTRLMPGIDRWDELDLALVSNDGRDVNVAAWVFRGPTSTRLVALGPDDVDSQHAIAQFYGRARQYLHDLIVG